MISDWRRKWSNYTDGATEVDFPFGWVQVICSAASPNNAAAYYYYQHISAASPNYQSLQLNSCGAYGAGYKNAKSPGGEFIGQHNLISG